MTEEVKEEVKELKKPEKNKRVRAWTQEERDSSREKYGCEIIVENGSTEEIYTTNAPNDTFVVSYVYMNKVCMDLTRGYKVNIFDMYWDKFKEELQNISFGKGNIRPNVWGYQAPVKKKKGKR